MRAKHLEARKAYDASRGSGWDRSGREKYESTEPQKWHNHVRNTYGISGDDYEKILALQGGVCAICRKACTRTGSGRLCVDHDHESGQVRGLLCFKCNVGIGHLADDVELLKGAVSYLERAARAGKTAVFVCGPMSGLPDFNYPAFNAAAAALRAIGHHVENPAANPVPTCGTWEGYMRLSIAQLVTCDAILLLPGWQKSRGANIEAGLAHALGMQVIEAAA